MHDSTTVTTLTPEGDEALDELSRFIVQNARPCTEPGRTDRNTRASL